MTKLPLFPPLRETLLFIALEATPAAALSCLPPDAVRLFQFATDSSDSFLLVKGVISSDNPISVPEAGRKESARTVVRVTGQGLSDSGFDAPFDGDVTLELTCLSAWCAEAPGDAELIMAIKFSDGAYMLRIDPCGGNAVPWTEDGERRLLACQRDGDCQLADF